MNGVVYAPIGHVPDHLVILDAARRLYVGQSRDGSYWHVVSPLHSDVTDGDGNVVRRAGEASDPNLWLATIGPAGIGSTLVVEIPGASDQLTAYWEGAAMEPFEFSIELDPWLIGMVHEALHSAGHP